MHHPRFTWWFGKRRAGSIAFLFLDAALGEKAVSRWLGVVTTAKRRTPGDAVDFGSLRRRIEQAVREAGWADDFAADGEGVTYQPTSPDAGLPFLRADVVVGSTLHLDLVDAYAEGRGGCQDPLAGTGASYAFVELDASALRPRAEVLHRGEIEDAIVAGSDALRAIGGAHGLRHAYIDLLLLDERRAIEDLRRVVAARADVPRASLRFFAATRRGEVVKLR